jgi:anaerobic dimethyl sulfoxide reductase subunit A
MHPDDARARTIEPHTLVRIENSSGRMKIRVRITDEIMQGVVCLTQGQWPEFLADDTECAGSVNILTTSEPTLPSQGSRTHSIGVTVLPD